MPAYICALMLDKKSGEISCYASLWRYYDNLYDHRYCRFFFLLDRLKWDKNRRTDLHSLESIPRCDRLLSICLWRHRNYPSYSGYHGWQGELFQTVGYRGHIYSSSLYFLLAPNHIFIRCLRRGWKPKRYSNTRNGQPASGRSLYLASWGALHHQPDLFIPASDLSSQYRNRKLLICRLAQNENPLVV